MTGMATVLAAHDVHEFGREEGDASRWFDRCICGFVLFDIDHSPEHKVHAGKSYADSAFAAHVAEALTAAGYGSQHDAWAEGAEASTDHWISTQYNPNAHGPVDPPANPYPAGAAS